MALAANEAENHQTCLVTGASGYLGSRVKRALEERGWRVVGLTQNPRPDASAVRFRLGSEIAPEALAGASSLVHCAYDFRPLSWPQLQGTNVEGSEKLFRAARQASVKNVVNISSISAFAGCRSLYGRAKLETEGRARSYGATSIRPGLIYGDAPGGMFGRLVRQVERARLLPLFGGGSQIQYLLHEEDLAHLICRCATGEISSADAPITVAHEQPWTFRQLLEQIAQSQGKRISFVSVPWRLGWVTLKLAELARLPVDFRSDSLVSLMYQNPAPSFERLRALGVDCRPFRLPVLSQLP